MQIKLSEEQTKKFWNKVNKTESCWIWRGGIVTRGYGYFILVPAVKAGVHRISWAIHNGGEIDDTLAVCHKCDNPSCINPDHLFLATQAANVADKVKKGRHYVNMKHCNAKLTPSQIEEIRRSYIPRITTQKFLSEKYGITRSNVHYIIKGKSWKNLPSEIIKMDERFKLSGAQKEQIKIIYKSGQYSSRQLAKMFNIGKTHILRIIHK